MALPEIWHYDAETGVLLWPGTADPSPLDPPGIWLVPAYATDIAPPAVPDGQQAVFDNGTWRLENIPPPEPEPELLPVLGDEPEITVTKPGTGT